MVNARPARRSAGWRGRMGRWLALGAVVVGCAVTSPVPSKAQVLPTVVGGAGGLVAGAYVSSGLYVLKSRTSGWMLGSVDDLVAPQAIPLLAAPVAGALLGSHDSYKLGQAGLWGGVGLASGAVLGATAGHLIWGDTEGRWAGGVIGSTAGLLVGIVVGALRDEGLVESPAGPQTSANRLQFAFPAPWSGRE